MKRRVSLREVVSRSPLSQAWICLWFVYLCAGSFICATGWFDPRFVVTAETETVEIPLFRYCVTLFAVEAFIGLLLWLVVVEAVGQADACIFLSFGRININNNINIYGDEASRPRTAMILESIFYVVLYLSLALVLGGFVAAVCILLQLISTSLQRTYYLTTISFELQILSLCSWSLCIAQTVFLSLCLHYSNSYTSQTSSSFSFR